MRRHPELVYLRWPDGSRPRAALPFALSLSKGPASAGQCQLVPRVLRQAQHERIVLRASLQTSPAPSTVVPQKIPFALSLSKGPASAGQCQLAQPVLRQAQHERSNCIASSRLRTRNFWLRGAIPFVLSLSKDGCAPSRFDKWSGFDQNFNKAHQSAFLHADCWFILRAIWLFDILDIGEMASISRLRLDHYLPRTQRSH